MHINIKDILDERGIRRYELAQKIDVTYPTITSIYNGTSTSIRFDTLEKICKELNCTPNDILIFDKEENHSNIKISADFPMNMPE